MIGQRYLLDTNVLSETRRKNANPDVISFLSSVDPSALSISVLSLGELRKGIALKKKTDYDTARKLAHWVDGLELGFSDRILNIDAAIARLWGEWSAQRPRPVVDILLAATAVVHDMTLVTRNTADVADLKVKLFNPWKS